MATAPAKKPTATPAALTAPPVAAALVDWADAVLLPEDEPVDVVIVDPLPVELPEPPATKPLAVVSLGMLPLDSMYIPVLV